MGSNPGYFLKFSLSGREFDGRLFESGCTDFKKSKVFGVRASHMPMTQHRAQLNWPKLQLRRQAAKCQVSPLSVNQRGTPLPFPQALSYPTEHNDPRPHRLFPQRQRESIGVGTYDDPTMAARGVSLLKFVGTVSLGLLTVRFPSLWQPITPSVT